ncbi:MAG: hypothetical protein ABWZ25_18135 [Chitinophagaceae bacterium]
MGKMILLIVAILLQFGCGSQDSIGINMEELLQKQRTQYIENFKVGFAQKGTKKSAIEIMLQITSDQNRNLPEVFQLNRFDMLTVNDAGKYDITEFNLSKDSVWMFDPMRFPFRGIQVEIHPFVWNGCEISCNDFPQVKYSEWAARWLDMEDSKDVGTDGFQNVIHSVTFPQLKNGKWTTSIDFGSAPPDALMELLEILEKEHVGVVEIHSRTFLE